MTVGKSFSTGERLAFQSQVIPNVLSQDMLAEKPGLDIIALLKEYSAS